MSSWKTIQAKKQIKKKTKWALIILGIVFGLLIIGNIVKLIKIVFSPWQSTSIKKDYLVTGEFNINLLIKAKKISLLTFSAQNQQITIIDIPDNLYLDVTRGFGKWELRSIFDLGQSQVDYGGDRLLKESLSNFLGLPIDGLLLFKDKYSQIETTVLVDQLRKDPFILLNILPSVKTDLTPFELIKLKMGLSSVRFDKIKQIDLERENLFQKDKLADGTVVYNPDLVKLDSITAQLAEPSFYDEHKTIAVFNSTQHPLLAQRAARVITNIGGNVIIISNGQKNYTKTAVYGEESKTLKRLRQIFSSNDTIEPKVEDLVSSRAQINIILGEDYFK